MYLFFLWRREVLKSESFNVFDSCVNTNCWIQLSLLFSQKFELQLSGHLKWLRESHPPKNPLFLLPYYQKALKVFFAQLNVSEYRTIRLWYRKRLTTWKKNADKDNRTGGKIYVDIIQSICWTFEGWFETFEGAAMRRMIERTGPGSVTKFIQLSFNLFVEHLKIDLKHLRELLWGEWLRERAGERGRAAGWPDQSEGWQGSLSIKQLYFVLLYFPKSGDGLLTETCSCRLQKLVKCKVSSCRVEISQGEATCQLQTYLL